mmetsp:Transcript_2378/g.5137  ORF Transcript_2378/g.5137 Transcript_2378/m.5137 type:complete len:133 (+) Transcript_2378:590-988(+)
MSQWRLRLDGPEMPKVLHRNTAAYIFTNATFIAARQWLGLPPWSSMRKWQMWLENIRVASHSAYGNELLGFGVLSIKKSCDKCISSLEIYAADSFPDNITFKVRSGYLRHFAGFPSLTEKRILGVKTPLIIP